MTRMMASMRTPEEAEIALAAGVDIIDFEGVDPGAVGAAVNRVGGRRTVSVASGDWPVRPDLLASKMREAAATGADYCRIGILPGSDVAPHIAEMKRFSSKIKPIGVFFCDVSPDFSLLGLLAHSGFAAAMIDTRMGRLLDHISIDRLLAFVRECHATGLIAGFAGSLEKPDIPRLLVLMPDLLSFDDALRGSNGRSATVDPVRVRAVRALIPLDAGARANDFDCRSIARGRCASATADDEAVDLVFVEDLVLPVFIGAYARERDTPQLVRFGVTASVMRAGRIAEDMGDVFSYDLITDGIRMLIASGHVTFVETLAERIAAKVLDHPRVTKVVVRVEKLETGSGTVGVEIERRRTEARATDRQAIPQSQIF